jgi:hypothetical protein
MLKLTVAVLAVVLVSTAAAAGWKDLRVDASSEEAFAKSLQTFYQELSPERRHVFGEALMDIWLKGAKDGEANRSEYTVADYYRQLDGLSYEEVVTLTDPTGATAKQRYQAAKRMGGQRSPPPPSPQPSSGVGRRPTDADTILRGTGIVTDSQTHCSKTGGCNN